MLQLYRKSIVKNHPRVNTESGFSFFYRNFVQPQRLVQFFLFLGRPQRRVLSYLPRRTANVKKRIKNHPLNNYREWSFFIYYPLRASTESGVILRILREFASGAYLAYVTERNCLKKFAKARRYTRSPITCRESRQPYPHNRVRLQAYA